MPGGSNGGVFQNGATCATVNVLRLQLGKDVVSVHNERVKMLAGFMNSLSLAMIALGVLRPFLDDTSAPDPVFLAAGVFFHLSCYVILGLLRSGGQ